MTDDERYKILCTLKSEMRQTYNKIQNKLKYIYTDCTYDPQGYIDEELSESLLNMYQYTEHYRRILNSIGDENGSVN